MSEKEVIAKKLIDFLESKYAESKCSLNFKNPYQLIVATILSAQCTDERVNKVTKVLFDKYKDFEELAQADIEELMDIVRPTGFFKNKAKNIKKLSEIVVSQFKGELPNKLEDLVKLPGVGRKTANVVLGNCFGEPGIVVDTHVKRISKRLGLTDHDDPDKIEKDLMRLIPKEKWTKWSHQMIDFGREICKARKPLCNECELFNHCRYAKENMS